MVRHTNASKMKLKFSPIQHHRRFEWLTYLDSFFRCRTHWSTEHAHTLLLCVVIAPFLPAFLWVPINRPPCDFQCDCLIRSEGVCRDKLGNYMISCQHAQGQNTYVGAAYNTCSMISEALGNNETLFEQHCHSHPGFSIATLRSNLFIV